MSLVELLVFLLTSAGLTVGVVGSSLLEPIRSAIFARSNFLKELLSCPMCTGLWVGGFLSVYFDVNFIVAGLMSSVFSWIVYSFVDMTNAISFYYEALVEEEEQE
tara:strand:- start:4641 stop:4955 length:315 start_codon:yes stop_codon:yes gene_type:complete